MRSMVERDAPVAMDLALNRSDSRSSLSDPALPGCVSLRERKTCLADPPGDDAAMSFQAYLDNIQAKTGKTPADLRALAAARGFADAAGLRPGVKAGQIVQWLKDDFALGHGHAMAIVALLKGKTG